MYSVVMATMLAAGSTTPAWHHCRSSCHGCYSGCYSSCYSCYSGYNGYRSGCYCSCNGYSCYSGYGAYACSSCYSCYSCSCSCSVGYYSCSVCSTCSTCCCTTSPRVIEVPGKKTEKIDPPKKTEGGGSVSTQDQQKSRVTVVLPSDARLWVDNVECPLTSTVRSFDTPNLNANQQYVYNFRMEVVRDGRTVTDTHRAVITPGQPVNVDFNQGAISTASR